MEHRVKRQRSEVGGRRTEGSPATKRGTGRQLAAGSKRKAHSSKLKGGIVEGVETVKVIEIVGIAK